MESSYTTTKRRPTVEVFAGRLSIGGGKPISVQSMTDTKTSDTEASLYQIRRLASAGADLVRLTAQGVSQAQAIGEISKILRARGIGLPLSADIHFNPAAAFEAVKYADKVRINPGNFVDPARTFKLHEYTDEEYKAELDRIREKLVPLIGECRRFGVCLRIGVNHGSLSDRIMSRYGDTPEGVVESAMEFLRICRDENFNQVVLSIKASNVSAMVCIVRLAVKAMHREGMEFPFHLGVTEAGDGDDARIKSCMGIGSLLVDGIGDTIRVSLSEDPVEEIPVGRALIDYVESIPASDIEEPWLREYDTSLKSSCTEAPRVVGYDMNPEDFPNDCIIVEGNTREMLAGLQSLNKEYPADKRPFTVIKVNYPTGMSREEIMIRSSVDAGRLFLEGYGDALWLDAPGLSKQDNAAISLSILQASRRRMSKTEFIACPGCGRTMFDLHDTLAQVKKATEGFPGLKIGVMGCIVNGPGEMADADYGYVGAAAGKVSIYKGKNCVYKNVQPKEALDLLLDLIKQDPRIGI